MLIGVWWISLIISEIKLSRQGSNSIDNIKTKRSLEGS